MNMKKFRFMYAAALMVGMTALVTSCSKDDKNDPEPIPTGEFITIPAGEITGNDTLKAINTYLLTGFVYVTEGATLTIEPGTIIKGDKDTKATLVVERGGKIMAQGTKDKPIVFTSNQPKGQRTYGDWGGIVICGKAKINATGGENKIEGGPRSMFGGNDDADNSGILSYVRIEFSGVEYQVDNEINGLTMGGVGSGTQVDHIQVSYCGDDSYEWFGGAVNCKYLVAFRGWDDEFDTDNGFSGKLQFLVGLRDWNVADKSKSNGFESDNDATGSSNEPFTSPVFSNVSLFGPYADGKTADPTGGNGTFQASMHLRRNTKLQVHNSVFAGWPIGLFIDGSASQANATNNELAVKNSVLSGMLQYGKAAFDSTYVNNVANAVTVYANNSSLQLNDPFNLNAPNFTAQTGSPLLSGAAFDGVLSNSFFQQVAFRGAFGATDWTEGWCNWDPQNTDY